MRRGRSRRFARVPPSNASRFFEASRRSPRLARAAAASPPHSSTRVPMFTTPARAHGAAQPSRVTSSSRALSPRARPSRLSRASTSGTSSFSRSRARRSSRLVVAAEREVSTAIADACGGPRALLGLAESRAADGSFAAAAALARHARARRRRRRRTGASTRGTTSSRASTSSSENTGFDRFWMCITTPSRARRERSERETRRNLACARETARVIDPRRVKGGPRRRCDDDACARAWDAKICARERRCFE